MQLQLNLKMRYNMGKQQYYLTMVIMGLMTVVLCGFNSGEKQYVVDGSEGFPGKVDTNWFTDPFDSIYAQSSVALLLDSIIIGDDWYVDTLCKVNNFPVCIARDASLHSVIFCDGKVIAEAPFIGIEENGDNSFYKTIIIGDKRLFVDFSKEDRIKLLSKLSMMVLPGFKRCRMRRLSDKGDKVDFNVEVDVPTASVPNAMNMSKWLNNIALAFTSEPVPQLLSPEFAVCVWKNSSDYNGSLDDRMAVYDYLARNFLLNFIDELNYTRR